MEIVEDWSDTAAAAWLMDEAEVIISCSESKANLPEMPGGQVRSGTKKRWPNCLVVYVIEEDLITVERLERVT